MSDAPRKRGLRLLWGLLLLALLVGVVVLNRAVTGSPTTGASSERNMRHGFYLEKSAEQMGIDFVHQVPTFDPKLAHIMPQIASTGAAVSVADFDRDGWLDFYLTNSALGSKNSLYRNNGDGTFTDVAPEVGLADVNRPGTGVSMGSVWGDYDNDGYEDLFLYKFGRPELFHNMKGKRFVRVSERAGLPEWVNSNTAIWWDYDRDGLLDLYLGGYWRETIDLWHLTTTQIMPESFEYAENGGRDYVLHNLGNGRFEDTTAELGMDSHRWTLAAAAADLFGTHYPELFVANDYGVSELYANRGGEALVEVGRETGVGVTPKSGMNAAFGDIFNDGRLAIYKTNISEPGVLVQGNDLWVPTENVGAMGQAYEEMAVALGVALGGWSWGAQFGDLNNDGTQDLFLANGYVSAGERSSYWYDFSVIAVGHSSIISDAANWPGMHGRSLSGYQPSRVWLNDGLGGFIQVAQEVGVTDTYDGRAVAFADLNNDGDLDVLVANQRGPFLVYVNRVEPSRHWIAFELEGTASQGRGSNRSAIGARLELHWQDQVQVQVITGGSGFAAQNQRRVHHGLGEAERVDRVVIEWPSGQMQTIQNPAIDQLHHVVEPS